MYSRKISKKLVNYGSRCNSRRSECSSNSDESRQFDSDESLSEDDEKEVSKGIVGEVFYNRYICIKYLGKGTFCRVWLVYDIINLEFYAMKMVFCKYTEEAEHEIEMYKHLGNKYNNVTKFVDSFRYNECVCMILELMGICLIDLFNYYSQTLSENETESALLPRELTKKIFHDLFMGLRELHNKGIVHTDLKPENIMINIFPYKIEKVKNWFNSTDIIQQYKSLLLDSLPDNFDKLDSNKKKIVKKKCRIKTLTKMKIYIKQTILSYHKKIIDELNRKWNETEDKITSFGVKDSAQSAGNFDDNDYDPFQTKDILIVGVLSITMIMGIYNCIYKKDRDSKGRYRPIIYETSDGEILSEEQVLQ